MDGHARITRVDANRGLRDRLGHDRAAGVSVQDAELTLAVSDLQDLARHRSGPGPTTTEIEDRRDPRMSRLPAARVSSRRLSEARLPSGPTGFGGVAEWLGRGLQSPAHRFDSGPRLGAIRGSLCTTGA